MRRKSPGDRKSHRLQSHPTVMLISRVPRIGSLEPQRRRVLRWFVVSVGVLACVAAVAVLDLQIKNVQQLNGFVTRQSVVQASHGTSLPTSPIGRGSEPSRLPDIPTFALVAQNPTYYIGRAKQGDATSSVAVYQAFRACLPRPGSPNSRTGVPDNQDGALKLVPAHCAALADTSLDFLSLLEPAADAGNSLARLHYASEVFGLNLVRAVDGKALAGSVKDQAETRKAVRYLEEEATRGTILALLELAHGFETGAAGARNRSKSYAYLLALQEIAPHPLEGANELASRIRTSCSAAVG